MTSRVAALSGAAKPGGVPGVVPVVATPAMVDVAVDDVLKDYNSEMAEQVRSMWAKDPDTEVAVLLRAGAAALADRARFPKHARISANVPYRLQESEMRALIDWFPEMDLSFHVSAAHDHGMGAAVRHLDTLSMSAEIPPGMKFADFGGNEINYVNVGQQQALVVRTMLDDKDPAREQRRTMSLEMVLQKCAGAVVGTKEANAYAMAYSILEKEGRYLIDDRLETFNRKVLVGLMSHVYDVPISAIPLMMERCGMKLFLVTLHFSNRFYDTDAGEFKELGARYRIDRAKDLFEFGFIGSGAKWYSHKWSEFQRYGVDQVLHGRNRRYAYKIIKRRGETITCRILEIGGEAVTNRDQYYRVPDVPCVRVTADLGRTSHGHSRRVDEIFPEDVWNRMVREAAVDITRGVLDYHKCVGSYINISAGHSYNGQDAVLGTVPVDKVPLLVALSSVCAGATIARMRAGIKYGIDLELDSRLVREANLGKLSFKLMYNSLTSVVKAPLLPIAAGFSFLTNLTGEALLNRLVEVEPVRQVRRIPADVYQEVLSKQRDLPRDDFPAAQFLSETMDIQRFLREMVEGARNPSDQEQQVHTVEGDRVDDDGRSSTAVESQLETVSAEGPSWMPLGDAMRYEPQKRYHGPDERKAAIKEEIDIIDQEASNLEAWMTLRWSEIMVGREPDRDLIWSKRDSWEDLDAWYVNDSVVAHSVTGRPLNLFAHGGVFCPDVVTLGRADNTTITSKLRQVDEHSYSSPDGAVQRIHKVIGGPPYTGWVLVNSKTMVYNGPLIVAGLQRALDMPMDYDVGVYSGGPGAGKTYMIKNRWTKGQQVMSPLVLSVRDVRKALVETHGLSLIDTQRVARTIDSWLCFAGQGKPLPRCVEVLSDEVFNGRAARAYAVWGLMRAKRVVAYGDERQIPPVDPSGSVRLYKDVKPKHVVRCFLVYRYGPEVLAMINPHYGNVLRTVKPMGSTKVVWLDNLDDYKPKHQDVAILSMYQAQKVTARKKYPQWREKVSTTHEAQGKSVDEVFLAQYDGRVRPTGDKFDLYQDACYVNVGLSRVQKLMVIGNVAKPNLLNEWYARSQDPRRVKACADVRSAGQAIEFL